MAFLAPVFVFSQNIINFDIDKFGSITIIDSLILEYAGSENTTVLTPTTTGKIDTLETANIGDIAIQQSGGHVVVSTGGTQTIETGGTFERLDEGAIAYTGRHLHNFTHADGRLTYTGTPTKHFAILVHLSVESNEAAALVQLQLYKDGALIPLSNDQNDYTATDTDKGLTIVWLEEFATDEYVELWGTSDTNDDTFVLNGGSMVITQE